MDSTLGVMTDVWATHPLRIQGPVTTTQCGGRGEAFAPWRRHFAWDIVQCSIHWVHVTGLPVTFLNHKYTELC